MAGSGGTSSSRQLRSTTSTSAASKQSEMHEETKLKSEGLSFIRVLDRDYSRQLQIPQEFTSSFNVCLPHRFIIEDIVTKKCWRVEMEEDVDSQMYLREGWHDFVESHSLEAGNFLLFEYEKRSIFHVKVYDRNGCEKICGHHKLEKTAEPEELGENESFKYDKPVNVVIAQPHRQKRMRELCPQKNINLNKSGIYKKRRVAIKHYRRTAKASISETSCSFSITLHKRKKHQFIQLTIPKVISLQKLQNKEKVMLQNAEGGCWPAKLVSRRDGRRMFAQGWKKFVKDNEFSGGDTLNFEFISDDVVQVCVTRTSRVKQHSGQADNHIEAKNSQVTHHGEEANYQIEAKTLQVKHHGEEANDQIEARYIDSKCMHGMQETGEAVQKKIRPVEVSISGERVCFSTCLQKSHQFIQIIVPMAVTLKKLRNIKRVTLQDEKGSCWQVDVGHRRSGQAVFTQGWKQFLKDNRFSTGDVLEFEFVSEDLIQVRATKDSLADHRASTSPVKHHAEEENDQIEAKASQVTHVAEEVHKARHVEEANNQIEAKTSQVTLTPQAEEANKTHNAEVANNQIEAKTSQVKHHGEEANNQTEARYTDNKHDMSEKGEVVNKKIKPVEVLISGDRVRFSICLQKSHQFIQITVPKVVTLKKLRNKDKVTLQDEKGSCWQVNVAHRRSGQALFTQGWKKFLKDNRFTTGDVLEFEFVSDDLIQVRTTKEASLTDHRSEEAKYENEVSEMDCELRGDDNTVTSLTEDQVADDSIPPEQVSSELGTSTFSVTWRNDTMGFFLDIPLAVAEHQNLKNKETVAFRDPEGKCWPLQVRTWWDGRVVLTKGWVEFWKGQAITEGDSLQFEFVTEHLVQVTIIRGNPTLEPVIRVVGPDLPEPIIREVAGLPKANAATH